MEPIEELKNEHRGVETMLRIIEAVSKRYADGHEVDNRDFDAILEFLTVFVDRCHHGKEEDFLFPALEAAGVPRDQGPIGVLLHEHEQGRQLVAQLRDAAETFMSGDKAAGKTIEKTALEVVPLTLLGFEVLHNLRVIDAGGRDYAYKWPIYFFISVAFWNLVGAGVFGFLINPPIVLYYAQGINTTPIHSHAALFGVYGMLAISLMLFSVRHIVARRAWSDRLLKWSFWGLNGGLAAMVVFSLIPSGFYQLYYAIKDGLWYARSPEIASGPVIKAFSWARLVPDVIFAAGAILLFFSWCGPCGCLLSDRNTMGQTHRNQLLRKD